MIQRHKSWYIGNITVNTQATDAKLLKTLLVLYTSFSLKKLTSFTTF